MQISLETREFLIQLYDPTYNLQKKENKKKKRCELRRNFSEISLLLAKKENEGRMWLMAVNFKSGKCKHDYWCMPVKFYQTVFSFISGINRFFYKTRVINLRSDKHGEHLSFSELLSGRREIYAKFYYRKFACLCVIWQLEIWHLYVKGAAKHPSGTNQQEDEWFLSGSYEGAGKTRAALLPF